MSNEKINITVQKGTHGRLKALGAKDESFDTIIQRLLDFYDRWHMEVKAT
jgi:hypothetical protein